MIEIITLGVLIRDIYLWCELTWFLKDLNMRANLSSYNVLKRTGSGSCESFYIKMIGVDIILVFFCNNFMYLGFV